MFKSFFAAAFSFLVRVCQVNGSGTAASRMASRSLEATVDRGVTVSVEMQKSRIPSEIQFQFKFQLLTPNSHGERSNQSSNNEMTHSDAGGTFFD